MDSPESGVSRRSFLRTGSAAAALLATAAVRSAGSAPPNTKQPGASPATLTSGSLVLTVPTVGGDRVRLSRSDAGSQIVFETEEPLRLQLLDHAGAVTWLSGTYSTVTPSGKALRCVGEIRTPAGTFFRFTDTYTPAKGTDSLVLERNVQVQNPAPDDTGFLTRFSLHAATPVPLREHDFFVPGIWYRDNQNVPPRALAADLSEDAFIIREDRMPLPLVMMRARATGHTITLSHIGMDAATCLADYTGERVVDERIQVASLGVDSQENPAVAFHFPASEGARSYLRAPAGKRWVERFHPVRAGVKHAYKIEIALSTQPDFPQAMRHAWRLGFGSLPHTAAKTDIAASYEASIHLIADWCKTTNGATGVPFRLRLPKGELMEPADINYQMGFVGQQLPLGYHLLRYGLLHNDEEIRRKGEQVVDFWAASSLTPEGLPRTWYDTYPQPHWRKYNTFLRVATDGMIGALRAWDIQQARGKTPKPEWRTFCTGFGDWLIRNQNADGSWYREYDWSGKPINQGKQNTTHPIPYLIALARATGQAKYQEAALRAADWCYPNVHQAFAYVGGTADNPNVIDKEAGFLAINAFLALHDATGEKRWLDAAAQAGDFTETWVYSWNVPIPTDDPAVTYPKGCATSGFSIIATGHSGADLFMAGAPFFYYRLYLATGDTHYADMARQLLFDTKQGMEIDGKLGYGHPGLCTEALSLAPPRGRGVNTWLPWLTASMIEPIVRLQEAYGVADTPTVSPAKLKELRARDAAFGKTQGLLSAK